MGMHMTKLPNIVNINPNAFDENTFKKTSEIERLEELYRGSQVIRWRYKTDPNTGEFIRDDNNRLIRESNSRFVRWSDGSLTLHVNGEIFEIDEMKSAPAATTTEVENKKSNASNIFPGLNGYLYL